MESKLEFNKFCLNDVATINESSIRELAIESKRSSTVMNKNLPKLQNDNGKKEPQSFSRQSHHNKFPAKSKDIKKKMF